MTLSSVLATAGTMLLHGTILAGVTKIVCAATGSRLRPPLRAILWTIVLVKFFVPPALPGEFTFSRWLSASSPLGSISSASKPAPPLEQVLASRASIAPESVRPEPVATGIWIVYLLGLFIVVPRSLLGSRRAWRRVRSLPEAPTDVVEQVALLARRIGLRRAPRVRISSDDSSPFVAGAARPVLVLPHFLLQTTSSAGREPLVLHELAHLRRGDLWVRHVQNTARLVFYFWPPVWWVCRSIERASELACDERALADSSVAPRAYATTLLDLVRRRRPTELSAQALALAPSGRDLLERFEMILNHERKPIARRSVFAFAAVLAWAVFSLGGGAAAAEKKGDAMIKRDVMFLKAPGRPGHVEMLDAGRWSTLLLLQPSTDKNGDGEVSDEEAMAFAESRSAPERARLLKVAPEADADRDGQLDSRELYALLDVRLNPFSAPLSLTAGPIKVNPPEADLDGDGKITEAEAHEYIETHHPEEPIQFEWVTEDETTPGKKNVDRKVIRIMPPETNVQKPR